LVSKKEKYDLGGVVGAVIEFQIWKIDALLQINFRIGYHSI
jgi:hypothetical protein